MICYFRFFQLDVLGSVSLWQNKISNHVIDRRRSHINVSLENVYSKYKDKEILDLKDQFEILSSLPNVHRWNVLKSHDVKMDGYFINNGNSPRIRLKRNFLTVFEDYFYKEIKNDLILLNQ